MFYFFKNILFLPLFTTEFSQKMKLFFVRSIKLFPKNKKIFSKEHYFSQKLRFSLRKNKIFIKYEIERYLGAGRFTKETKKHDGSQNRKRLANID